MPETLQKFSKNSLKSFNFKEISKQYLILLREPRFIIFTCMGFFIVGAIIAWIVAAPMLIMQTLKYSLLDYCLMQVLVFGSFILGTYSVKFLINKYSPSELVKIGTLISLFAGILILPVLFINFRPLEGLVFCLMIYCFGAAIGAGSAQRLALENPKAPMGATMALFSTLISAGAFSGSLAVSIFKQTSVWPLGLIFVTISFIVYFIRQLAGRYL